MPQKMRDFQAKLVEQFVNFKIGVPNFSKHEEHLYADYIELVALFSARDFVTATDILDRLKDEGNVVKSDDLDDEDAAEKNDENETWINELFGVLEQRSIVYGNDYPFDLSHNKIVLTENIVHKHKVYLYMLISSNLNLFSSVSTSLTSDFETVSYYALLNYLPGRSKVKQFGKQSEYEGSAIQKIRHLADDLNMSINEHEINNVSEKNMQERGLDLIGWIPFSDDCPNMIVVLGQCACGKSWFSKYHDTKRFANYLNFYKLRPISAMFIPYSLVGKHSGSRFYRSDDIEDNSLLFERKRITELFPNETQFQDLESRQVIDMCLTYVEDII